MEVGLGARSGSVGRGGGERDRGARRSGRFRGELADEPAPGDLARPFQLELEGAWGAAAELWSEIGCPYEAALALAEADDEEALRRSLAELQRLGARPGASRVARTLRDRGVR